MCSYEEVEMILVHLIPDHVNRRVSIRLRISVSSSVLYAKEKSALIMFDKE